MRMTTQRDALLELLGRVKSAVPSRSYLPVCGSVLLRAGQGKLSVTANNLEACLTGSCQATVTRGGAMCAMPQPLETFLKAVDTESIRLSTAGKRQLKVEAGNAATTLEGFEAQDFPPIPQAKGTAISISNLVKALGEVDYAICRDGSRPVLEGVCFTNTKAGMELAAADGFRLAITTVKANCPLVSQVVVPAVAVSLLRRLMPGKVTMRQGTDAISFEGEGLVLVAKPVQGNYPNYQQLIPKNGTLLVADAKALRDALKVVTAIKPANNIVRLQTRGKALIVSTKEEEKGHTEVKVAARGKAKIAFNGNYLKDLLARVDGQVTLRTKDPSTPGVVRHNGTVHVLMPLFVQW